MKNFDLLNEKKMLICAHRGVCGGDIPCNTRPAFDIALMQGADIVELDVTASADGELFVFHPEMENRQLGKSDLDIRKLPADEIKKLHYINFDGAETAETIYLLDDIFEHLKGKCYINIDKFGDNPVAIMKKVQKHGMKDQIILKSAPNEAVLQMVEETAPDIHYFAIISRWYDHYATHEMLMRRNLNYGGLEVKFDNDDSPLVCNDFIDRLHRDGKFIWGNSILFNYRVKLAGVHSDDTALNGDPATGWGWFADKEFDVLQTDWPREVVLFLQNYHGKHSEIS